MQVRVRVETVLAAVLLTLLAGAPAAPRPEEPMEPPFQYVGGTEKLELDCRGKLEVTTSALAFTCPARPIEMPFGSIVLMQFRPDLSRHVRHLKLKWKVWPDVGGGKKNRYFTVVYREEGVPHAVILKVEPLLMRPYLAEIELKSGKRVEVKGYEQYE